MTFITYLLSCFYITWWYSCCLYHCTLHYQLLKFPKTMALPPLQCTIYDFTVVYYVFASLSIVNNLLYYVFNSHIFRCVINRKGSCTSCRCELVLISGGGKLEISIIEWPLTYCFVPIILTMSIKFPYLFFLFVVIVCVLFWKCLNTLLKFFRKHQLRKLGLKFIFLAILSKYLTVYYNNITLWWYRNQC